MENPYHSRIDWSNYTYMKDKPVKEVLNAMTTGRRLVKVWIQGSCFSGSIRTMLAANQVIEYRPAKSIQDADMILYTGGADVNPILYGENKLDVTSCDSRQDKADGDTYLEAKKLGKFQVGICRGAQLLNVMNGGILWQDVNHHAGRNHNVTDVITKKTFEVSSLHHQAVVLTGKGKLLAWTELSDRKLSSKGAWTAKSGKMSLDVEAFFYPETRSLGVQWHPELGPKPCIDLFFDYIERFIDRGDIELEKEVDRAVG